VKHDVLQLDALWNDARFVDRSWIDPRPTATDRTNRIEPLYHFRKTCENVKHFFATGIYYPFEMAARARASTGQMVSITHI